MTQTLDLATLFNFGEDGPAGLYPFHARALAAKFHPETFAELLYLGKATIDFVYSRPGSFGRPSRQVRAGYVTLYFPERWLSLRETQGLMAALVDVHLDYPLKEVHIITGSPVILTDFVHTSIGILEVS